MEKISTVQTTELVHTSQSWDGVDLPDYLVGKPEIARTTAPNPSFSTYSTSRRKASLCRCSIRRYL